MWMREIVERKRNRHAVDCRVLLGNPDAVGVVVESPHVREPQQIRPRSRGCPNPQPMSSTGTPAIPGRQLIEKTKTGLRGGVLHPCRNSDPGRAGSRTLPHGLRKVPTRGEQSHGRKSFRREKSVSSFRPQSLLASVPTVGDRLSPDHLARLLQFRMKRQRASAASPPKRRRRGTPCFSTSNQAVGVKCSASISSKSPSTAASGTAQLTTVKESFISSFVWECWTSVRTRSRHSCTNAIMHDRKSPHTTVQTAEWAAISALMTLTRSSETA